MPTKKITDLQLISALTGSENLPVDDGIETYRMTPTQMYTYMRSKLPPLVDEISNLAIVTSVASSALTITIKNFAGNNASSDDPIRIAFRNATASSGAFALRTLSSALSLTISSGSTLGHTNGKNRYIYVYMIDNAGSMELAVSSILYDQGSLISTTAEGGAGAADNNSPIYSSSARTNVPFRIIGRLKSNQVTAGTWAANMLEVTTVPFELRQTIEMHARLQSNLTPGANAAVVFDTVENDPLDAYSTSTGGYRVDRDGEYLVTITILTSGSANNYFLKLDTTAKGYFVTCSSSLINSGSKSVSATAGQIIYVMSENSVLISGAATYGSYCTMSVRRL